MSSDREHDLYPGTLDESGQPPPQAHAHVAVAAVPAPKRQFAAMAAEDSDDDAHAFRRRQRTAGSGGPQAGASTPTHRGAGTGDGGPPPSSRAKRVARKCRTETKTRIALLDHKLAESQRAGLTVNMSGGRPTIWGSTRRRNLTWSFSSENGADSFSSWAAQIREGFDSWERVCGVNFTYRASGGFITVRWATPDEETESGGEVVAEAFFPGEERRHVILYELFKSNPNSAGVLRHELGHALGFRHEHIWFSNNPTDEHPDETTKLLMEADRLSVMNYRKLWQDEAAGKETLLSTKDVVGACSMGPRLALSTCSTSRCNRCSDI